MECQIQEQLVKLLVSNQLTNIVYIKTDQNLFSSKVGFFDL